MKILFFLVLTLATACGSLSEPKLGHNESTALSLAIANNDRASALKILEPILAQSKASRNDSDDRLMGQTIAMESLKGRNCDKILMNTLWQAGAHIDSADLSNLSDPAKGNQFNSPLCGDYYYQSFERRFKEYPTIRDFIVSDYIEGTYDDFQNLLKVKFPPLASREEFTELVMSQEKFLYNAYDIGKAFCAKKPTSRYCLGANRYKSLAQQVRAIKTADKTLQKFFSLLATRFDQNFN